MKQKSESASTPGVLTPSVPWDIGARSQRQRILSAMARSCAEKTFSAMTIADIVSHASISRATFYKHFANKSECFDAAAGSFVAELRDVAAEAHLENSAAPDAIREAIAAVLGRLADKPAYARLLLVEAPIVNPEIVRSYRDLVIDSLAAQLQTSKRDNHGKADPQMAFGRARLLVADYLAAGDADRLPSLLPELVYVAMLPYLGQEAALEEAGVGN